MRSATTSNRFASFRLRRILLLGCLLLLAGGCANMSRPTIGISGTNDSERPVGH